MKVARSLQRDRYLRSKHPCSADVLFGNPGLIEPIQYSEHPEHLTLGPE